MHIVAILNFRIRDHFRKFICELWKQLTQVELSQICICLTKYKAEIPGSKGIGYGLAWVGFPYETPTMPIVYRRSSQCFNKKKLGKNIQTYYAYVYVYVCGPFLVTCVTKNMTNCGIELFYFWKQYRYIVLYCIHTLHMLMFVKWNYKMLCWHCMFRVRGQIRLVTCVTSHGSSLFIN